MINKSSSYFNRYFVLFGVIFVFCACLAAAFYSIYRENQILGADGKDDLRHVIFQTEIDVLKFLQEMDRYIHSENTASEKLKNGLPEPVALATGGSVSLAFDILWSRLVVLSEGDWREQIVAIGEIIPLIERSKETLKRTEPKVLSLKPGQFKNYLDLQSEYRAMAREFHDAILRTKTFTNQEKYEKSTRVRQWLRYSTLLILAVLISGVTIIYFLLREIRLSDRLHDETKSSAEQLRQQGLMLQEMVDDQTIDLITAKDEAETANGAKSEFLASMSHELRTPLNAVLGFAQMLQIDRKNPLSQDQNEYVDCILTGGRHLLELVNEILDLATIEANKSELHVEDIVAHDVMKECLDLMMPLGKAQTIRFRNEFGVNTSTYVRSDRLRLKQILLNLLSNAVKYNRPRGTVTVQAYQTDDGFLRISIVDTGIGIRDQDQEKLFDMFHRITSDATIAKEGTGIGLAVTKLLVERMDGTVGFESKENVGSTFWLELPLSQPTAFYVEAPLSATG